MLLDLTDEFFTPKMSHMTTLFQNKFDFKGKIFRIFHFQINISFQIYLILNPN